MSVAMRIAVLSCLASFALGCAGEIETRPRQDLGADIDCSVTNDAGERHASCPEGIDCSAGNRDCLSDSDCGEGMQCGAERCFDPEDERDCRATPCLWFADCPSESCNSTAGFCN